MSLLSLLRLAAARSENKMRARGEKNKRKEKKINYFHFCCLRLIECCGMNLHKHHSGAPGSANQTRRNTSGCQQVTFGFPAKLTHIHRNSDKQWLFVTVCKKKEKKKEKLQLNSMLNLNICANFPHERLDQQP